MCRKHAVLAVHLRIGKYYNLGVHLHKLIVKRK